MKPTRFFPSSRLFRLALLGLACLVLVAALPRGGGLKWARSLPQLLAGAVTAAPVKVHRAERLPLTEVDSLLGPGRALFIDHCTACHSSRFVYASGVLSGEARPLVSHMLAKGGHHPGTEERRLLTEYLEYKLPLR